MIRWDLNPGEWLEWKYPWALLLIVLVLLGLFLRRTSYNIPFSFSHLPPFRRVGRIWTRVRFALPLFFGLLAMGSALIAIVDITRTTVFIKEQKSQHRIFAAVDKSSSTWNFSAKHPSITCATTAKFYPRVWGECRAMLKLIEVVAKRAGIEKGMNPTEDLISIILFAREAAVISYPTSDYPSLKKRMETVDWLGKTTGRLGIHTNIHYAAWGMLRMALERNLRADSGLTQFSGLDMRILARALDPSLSRDFQPPRDIEAKLKALRRELRDTIFMTFTDALEDQMEMAMKASPYSLRKLLQLFAFLELQAVFISTDEFHLEMARLSKRTGFEDASGSQRGDFIMVRKERDYENIEALVEKVFKERFGMKITAPVERRVSYTEEFLLSALIFVTLALLSKLTVARSLTDP